MFSNDFETISRVFADEAIDAMKKWKENNATLNG